MCQFWPNPWTSEPEQEGRQAEDEGDCADNARERRIGTQDEDYEEHG